MTLPLALRNRLADLILEALHDAEARRGLETLAAVCADARALAPGAPPPGRFPVDLFEARGGGWRIKPGWRQHAPALAERAGRAYRVVTARRLDPPDPPLATALGVAAALFNAGLYFETHEVLEPHWMRAEGGDRESLQGLIQVAVGFQHLANGNLAGARALLHEGCLKLRERRLEELALDRFAQRVGRCREALLAAGQFDWATVPPFPVRD